MRFLILILFLNLSHSAGAQVETKNFTLLAYRQKMISGVAPNDYSANRPAQFQYFIFLSPKKFSNPVSIKKLCLNGQRHPSELEVLESPYIIEQRMSPESVRRDTLTPVHFLPAYKVNLKKPERNKKKKTRSPKEELYLKLNIGKVRIKQWTDLPDWIMP